MTLPKFPIQIVVIVLAVRSVEVSKIATEEASHQDDTSEWGQGRGTIRSHDPSKGQCFLRHA